MARENLRNARKAAGMTQRQVAEYLGISERMYQRIESGEALGKITYWDMLEDLFKFPQRQLREILNNPPDKANRQGKY